MNCFFIQICRLTIIVVKEQTIKIQNIGKISKETELSNLINPRLSGVIKKHVRQTSKEY